MRASSDSKSAFLKKRKAQIDAALGRYLEKYCGRANPVYPSVYYALFPGGKRIRPVLCLEACAAAGGDAKKAIPPATAIELIHCFSLVHDDLPSMDDDDYRRGRLSCHRKFGEAEAVLAGDALNTMAFGVLSEVRETKILKKLLAEISGAAGPRGMIGGQSLDIKYAGRQVSAKKKEEIDRLKTACLFSAPLRCGAIAAGAGSAALNRLSEFGRYFGMAFQLRDDIDDGELKKGSLNAKIKELNGAIASAKTTLDIFGKKAHNLSYLIDMLIYRQ